VLVELACNGMFGVGGGGMINPPDPHRTFAIRTARLVVAHTGPSGGRRQEAGRAPTKGKTGIPSIRTVIRSVYCYGAFH
jgi:hypothetical protein